ncbi:AraC family transcriptional regulator [Aeromonas crassostreae]
MSRLLHAVAPADKCLPEPAHFTRIERVLNHIHQHLDAPLSVSELAELSCWSRWQLQRVFHNETGLTVAAYVRELKLSQAAAALLDGRERVLDLALRHGYDAEASFSRAFKQQFGCSPLAYRKRGQRIGLRLPIQQIAARPGEGRWLQVRVESLPGVTLYGVRGEIRGLFASEPDFQQTVPAIWRALHAAAHLPPCSERLGVVDVTETNDEQQLPYWAGLLVEEGVAPPAGLTPLFIPPQEYAVLTHVGPIHRLAQTLNGFIQHWLPDSGYRGLDGYELERYGAGFNGQQADARMEYWLPIAPCQAPAERGVPMSTGRSAD